MYFCCMENEVNESFEILLAACRTADSNLAVAYKQLRDLLERLCRAQMQDESLQMTDLSARISFVSARAGLTISFMIMRKENHRLTLIVPAASTKYPLLQSGTTAKEYVRAVKNRSPTRAAADEEILLTVPLFR